METSSSAPVRPWKLKSSQINRRTLKALDISPKKSLGQNFMSDDAVLRDIVRVAGLVPEDVVVEVGPGTGALTRHLLETGARVTAVEKDASLHEKLTVDFEDVDSLKLICGDVLRMNMTTLLDEARAEPFAKGVVPEESPAPHLKVIANLPYYITKDFLLRTLPLGDRISRMILMLQHEVAARLTQETPGGPDWRAMNIIVQYMSHPKYLFKIDRRKYVPAPKCHGAVVDFRLRPPDDRPAVPRGDEAHFIKLVKKAFLQRRKALRNSLQPLVNPEQAVAALEAAGLTSDARAQELGLDEFVKLAWTLEDISQCNSSV